MESHQGRELQEKVPWHDSERSSKKQARRRIHELQEEVVLRIEVEKRKQATPGWDWTTFNDMIMQDAFNSVQAIIGRLTTLINVPYGNKPDSNSVQGERIDNHASVIVQK